MPTVKLNDIQRAWLDSFLISDVGLEGRGVSRLEARTISRIQDALYVGSERTLQLGDSIPMAKLRALELADATFELKLADGDFDYLVARLNRADKARQLPATFTRTVDRIFSAIERPLQ